ncbi:sensor histidine kinase [Spirosoma telluris]
MLILLRISVAVAQPSVRLPLQPEKLAYAKEVEQEASAKKDASLFAEAYYLYGKIHVAARDYLTAKRYFMKSLRIVEQKHQFDKISRIYSRLSWLEREQTNLTEALDYARLALAYARASTPKTLLSAYQSMSEAYLSICYDSLANAQRHSMQDSLFYYCKRTEQMAYRLNDSISIAGESGMLGNIYGSQRDPQAFQYYQKAIHIYRALNQKSNQVIISLQFARTYLQFNQPDKAYALLQQARFLYNSLNIREFEMERELVNTSMQYYQQKKDWKKAFDQSLVVRGFERGQLMADRNGAVSRLSIEYDTETKEAQLKSQQRELALSQQNQRTQRRFLLVLSALLLGMGVASVTFYRLSRKNRRLSFHNAALVQEQNHRVKNNLQLISSLLSLQSNRLADESARNAVEDSQRRIEVMSLLQRKLYDGDNLTTVPVADFVRELTEMVLQTFELDDVETTYHIPPTLTLSADYVMRIGLIVNELVTNACKYAFPENQSPALQIEATLNKTTFHLRVADNGKGFDTLPLSSKSFGMRLIQIQVEQLYGTFQFENKGGTLFTMSFTLLPLSPKWQKI